MRLPRDYILHIESARNGVQLTVEWQGELVRCKDCKYMTEHYDTDGNVPYWTCLEWDSVTDADGFCHYGERSEDE